MALAALALPEINAEKAFAGAKISPTAKSSGGVGVCRKRGARFDIRQDKCARPMPLFWNYSAAGAVMVMV